MHHIRRHTFQIQFSSQEKAFDLQTRFTELMHNALLPVIEEVFTQVSLPNVIIRLDTLNINLGEIQLDALEQDLPDKLRQQLTDALLAAIGEIRYFPQEKNQLITQEKADTEVLIYFLQNGTLPWWSSHARQADFSLANLLEQYIHTQPGLLTASLQQEMKAPEVRIRLTRQFPDEVLFQLLSPLIPARLSFVKALITGLIQARQAGKGILIPPAAFRELLWEFIWTNVWLQNRTSFGERQLAEELFTHISIQTNLPLPQVLWHLAVPTEILSSISTEQKAVQSLAQRIMAEKRLREPETFTSLWQTPTSLAALRTQTAAERFTALIQAAEPAQAESIEKMVRLLTQIFRQAATGTAIHLQKIDQLIREAFIEHLFAGRRAAFEMPVFLKKSLPLIINRLAIPIEQVAQRLAEAGSEAQPISQAVWQVIQENPQAFTNFPEITQAGKPSGNVTAYARLLLEGRIKPPVRYTDLDILRFFLQFGVIPWTERIRNTPDLIEQLIQEMMATQPEGLRQWIQSSGLLKHPIAVQRIQAQFSPEIAVWFLQETSQTAPAQTSFLSMEELTVQADVLIHYLWAYLETGSLPAEVHVSIPELIHTFVTSYPEISREFISTLPETQQQILLDISPELITFLASESGATKAGITNEDGATETDNKAEPRQPLSEEEKHFKNTNALDEDITTFTEQRVIPADELISSPEIPVLDIYKITLSDELTDRTEAKESPEIQSNNLLQKNTSDMSEQSLELPADLLNKVLSEPMQTETEIDKSETSPEQITDKKIDAGKEIEQNEYIKQENIEKRRQEKDTAENSNPLVYKDEKQDTENQETHSQKPEITPADDLKYLSPEEQATSIANIDSSAEQEDKIPVEKVIPSTEAPEATTDSQQTLLPDKQVTKDKKNIPAKPIPKKPQDSSKRYIWRQPEEPLYIRNAGLVLIHPFLTRFFTILKLTANKKFIDEQAAQRGVHLLHYISHKSEGAPEYELALNKVLCGLPVAMPLEKDVELTEEEKETCESLINGVIQNWPILKNTSPDNFRVSFLHREGRLVYTSEDWQLKVENRGYDILIDKLPWAYSIIKLPWMEKVLRVEWR